MNVTYPLSLKLALWLLLNLVLLTALALGLLIAQGGIGWEALVTGRAGDQLQRLAESVVRELGDASPAERDDLVDRLGATHGVQFLPVLPDGRQFAGTHVEIPPAVLERVLPRGPFGPRGPGKGRGGRPPPGKEYRPDAPAGTDRAEPPEMRRERARGRAFATSDSPRAYWIAIRAPFHPEPDAPPQGITLLVHTDSAWTMLRLLDLQPWLLAGGAVLAFSLLFWLPIVRGITRDLRRLSDATGRIAEGRFDTRVATLRRDELGHLGHSVNRMAARLDTLVNGQKRFLGDVAHELGSPLGRLQVATEILETRAEPALRDHVRDVREEVQHMAALVNELLAFTRAGLRPRDAELAAFELEPLVAEVLAREDPQRRVHSALAPQLRVRADRPLLARALGNLVRNALRYAGEDASITLTAHVDGPHAVIAVEDDGPGVPTDALARLGEPFYRPESARTRETGGVGLGLAIVRTSIAACGGETHFANRAPHGFRAELRLPV